MCSKVNTPRNVRVAENPEDQKVVCANAGLDLVENNRNALTERRHHNRRNGEYRGKWTVMELDVYSRAEFC